MICRENVVDTTFFMNISIYLFTLREMICPQYFHNIFITNPKWQVVIVGQKSNLNVRFKFEPITTNQLCFILKMLWT